MRAALSDPALLTQVRSAAAVDVIAIGKAAEPMLAAFGAVCPSPIRHVIAACDPPRRPLPAGASWFPGAHPVPDEHSVQAALAALALARATTRRDVLIALLSGGASSMMALPAGDLPLADKQQTIRTLLTEGANIRELNTVRKHLSAIKGGRLAAAAEASIITLVLSDVVDDELSVIGSGPTVSDPTSASAALDVLEEHGGRDRYPARAVTWLQHALAGHGDRRVASDDCSRRSVARVIGNAATALSGAFAAAERLGYHACVMNDRVRGEARRAAVRYLENAAHVAASLPRPACILAAGETTVRVSGSGKGGRNQEFALALVEPLADWVSGAVAASVGTDGIDGPTDAAGAIVDVTTLARAKARGLSSRHSLDDNDSHAFFDALGDLVRLGPTGTNVADIQILMLG